LLHEKIADQFLDRFLNLAKSIRLGDPLDIATEMGPLTSRTHQDTLRIAQLMAEVELPEDPGPVAKVKNLPA